VPSPPVVSVRRTRAAEKVSRKALRERHFARLLDAAYQQLQAPIVLIRQHSAPRNDLARTG
jgi:hypothetical protein